MKLLKVALIDLLGIAGIGCISYGAYQYSNPLGLIVLGIGLIALAVLAGKNG